VTATQLRLAYETGGLDVHELADLLAHERARLYDELGLDFCQRQAAEDAVRLVLADEYGEAAR
jgi:hypothetical protein